MKTGNAVHKHVNCGSVGTPILLYSPTPTHWLVTKIKYPASAWDLESHKRNLETTARMREKATRYITNTVTLPWRVGQLRSEGNQGHPISKSAIQEPWTLNSSSGRAEKAGWLPKAVAKTS